MSIVIQSGRARIALMLAGLLCVGPGLVHPAEPAAAGGLSAAQIVEKNIAARGGLSAWRALQTLSLSGKMDAGSGDSTARSVDFVRSEFPSAHKQAAAAAATGAQPTAPAAKQVELPFTLEVKRPNKSRLELVFSGKTAVQVYDGAAGWKLRPFLNRNDVEPFTNDELKSESQAPGIDGFLVDYSVKGTRIALDGVEPVEGHEAYKLKLILKDGTVRHVWIDAKSFLDVKVEGTPRQMDGRPHAVWVYQRDFRPVQGLMMPFEYETAVDGYRQTHKMIIEKAAVNPTLSDARFGKPAGA
jgi:hypothetical protein